MNLLQYAPLLTKPLVEVPVNTIQALMKDLGVMPNASAADAERARSLLLEMKFEKVAELLGRPEVLDKIKALFTPAGAAVPDKNGDLALQTVHQCGHCGNFSMVTVNVVTPKG